MRWYETAGIKNGLNKHLEYKQCIS
jgi:hypothetical protein